MSADDGGSISQFFVQLRAGGDSAADALWVRFCPRLLALARKTLAYRPQRVADAEDAVQSAFASFCLRVRRGAFPGQLGREDLWNLLAKITVRKALKQAVHEGRAKRGGGKVVGEGELRDPQGQPLPLDQLAAELPAADFDLCAEELLQTLEPELRSIAVFRMFGHTNAEIAAQLTCSERRVERKLHLIRRRWERFGGGEGSEI